MRNLSRPITLPTGAFRLDVIGLGSHVPRFSFATTGILGVGFDVTRPFEIGGQLVPLELSPRVQYTSPSLYAKYETHLGSGLPLAPTTQGTFPVRSSDPCTVDVRATLFMGAGAQGLITITPTLSLNARDVDDGSSVSFPVLYERQAGERVNWRLSSGIGLSRFEPRFGLSRDADGFDFDEVTVPATALVMYTVPQGRTGNSLLDLSAQLTFPQLYTHAPGTARTERLVSSASSLFVRHIVRPRSRNASVPSPRTRDDALPAAYGEC